MAITVVELTNNTQSVETAYVLMRRTLDLLPDGVLIIGHDRKVLYFNEAFERLWRIPHDVAEYGDIAMLDHVVSQLDDPTSFVARVEQLYESSEFSEDELTFKDGRVFNRRSVALGDGGGGYSRIWIFSDVTEAWSARIDVLTGLLNRRAYANELPEFMASTEYGRTKSFALVDVDQFKSYNDSYGHAAGDAVLERIGEILRHACDSNTASAYRIGGEEFAVTCVSDDDDAAVSFHQAILQHIRQEVVKHDGNHPHGIVTVSVGLGLFSGPADAKVVFASVDRALYRAKKLGRNTIALEPIGHLSGIASNQAPETCNKLQDHSSQRSMILTGTG